MAREILKYHELTKQEKTSIKGQLLYALNRMEEEQAADAGKPPQEYTMQSPLFKTMLPLSEAERWIDENNIPRITLITG